MIPQIIHYCWFGGKPLPDDVKRYIASWRKYCPKYEIKEWNESNFDISQNDYCKKAYAEKRWAFVADYARVKILHDYGGIYMDTDVELIRPFNNLLEYDAFMCFESDDAVSIGTFGSVKNLDLLTDLLETYDHLRFEWNDSHMVTNLMILTNLLVKKYNLKCNGMKQILSRNIAIFPMEAFIAKDYTTGWIMMNEETYAIHHYAASWQDETSRRMAERKAYYLRRYLRQVQKPLERLASCRIAYDDGGMIGLIRKIISHFYMGGVKDQNKYFFQMIHNLFLSAGVLL